MAILPTQKNLEELFLQAVQVSLDRLKDDPDCPKSAQQIVAQMEKLADWTFDVQSIKTLIDREGLSEGPAELEQEANALVEQFREADLVHMTRSGISVLPRGHALIHEHY